MIIHELNTFTSSAFGELGFNSSVKNKKEKNLDFTPSPKSDGIFMEEKQFEYLMELDMEIDTNENTPLSDILDNKFNFKIDFNDNNFHNHNNILDNDLKKQSKSSSTNLNPYSSLLKDKDKYNIDTDILSFNSNNKYLTKFDLCNKNTNNSKKTSLNNEKSNNYNYN
jgi:hypothetical protein